jgi:hypothetical protein
MFTDSLPNFLSLYLVWADFFCSHFPRQQLILFIGIEGELFNKAHYGGQCIKEHMLPTLYSLIII